MIRIVSPVGSNAYLGSLSVRTAEKRPFLHRTKVSRNETVMTTSTVSAKQTKARLKAIAPLNSR
ncbi:hypothetical protein BOA8489_01767 [Boseongicola aestuarii]|uniref:Uncharacterized protein n=1 Tax=Boseongicola aestuarii TaxID=1470561 RepID=A0A238IZ26_9RHOB|nr:hypothetical protein BOA8489_01767 [Boseongicola aestuarii]